MVTLKRSRQYSNKPQTYLVGKTCRSGGRPCSSAQFRRQYYKHVQGATYHEIVKQCAPRGPCKKAHYVVRLPVAALLPPGRGKESSFCPPGIGPSRRKSPFAARIRPTDRLLWLPAAYRRRHAPLAPGGATPFTTKEAVPAHPGPGMRPRRRRYRSHRRSSKDTRPEVLLALRHNGRSVGVSKGHRQRGIHRPFLIRSSIHW